MATWCLFERGDLNPRIVFMDVPTDDDELLGRLYPLFRGARSYAFGRVDDDAPAALVARILQGDGQRVTWREITAQTGAGVTFVTRASFPDIGVRAP